MQNLVVVLPVTKSKSEPYFTITAVTVTKNVASFGTKSETKTELRLVSNLFIYLFINLGLGLGTALELGSG